MKYKYLFVFFLSSLLLGAVSLCTVIAEVPNTAKIVFTADIGGNREIFLMDPDGSKQVNLTRNKADDISPRWSPGGHHILFVSDRGGIPDLYLMDADGGNVRRLFPKSVDRGKPAWSPDGKQVAYRRRELGKSFIYVARIDGKKEERVAIGTSPTWSPDGAEIAFITGAAEHRQMSIFNLHTGKQKALFPKANIPSWMTAPDWSPVGDQIAFSWLHRVPLKKFFQTETIYILSRDGVGEPVQIVGEAGPGAVAPVWEPSGESLLYGQADDVDAAVPSRLQIFKIALIGEENPMQLTHGGLWHYPGDWFDPAYALRVSPQPQLLTTIWGKVKRTPDP